MKKVLVVLGLCLFYMSMLAQEKVSADILLNGQNMPEFTITTMDGKDFKSSELEGKVVLINFFATWCPPCRKELPFVQTDIWDKYKDNDDFVLLIISREEKPEVVMPFVEDKKYPMTFYSDIDRSCYKLFAMQSIPRNYLFDESGKLVYQSIGFQEQEFKHLLASIEKELK